MSELGYLVVAYVMTAAAIGAYLLSLVRRQRAAERRLGRTSGEAVGRAGAQATAQPRSSVQASAPQAPAGLRADVGEGSESASRG